MTEPENPVHSANQTVEFIKFHALLAVEPPRSADILATGDDRMTDDDGDSIVVTWAHVTGGEHGTEGLQMKFRASTPPGIKHAIQRDGLQLFVNPQDSTDTVLVARGPNPPFIEHLKNLRFCPGAETIPEDLGVLPQSEWAEWIEGYLFANLQHLPTGSYSTGERAFTDEGELEDAVELLNEPTRYFHWSRFDQHYVAEYDGVGGIAISSVHFDDYCPAQADELYEFVQRYFEEWLERARQVEYRYSRDDGWQYRLSKDQAWESV